MGSEMCIRDRLKVERQDELTAFAEEVHQRTLREKNLIIVGVKESDGSVETRKKEDAKFCKVLFASIAPNVNFEGAIGIGKIRHDRERPLRVPLRTSEEKFRILRSCKDLRHHPEYRSVFINPDRAPLEQEAHKRIQEELKSRRENGEDDLVLYKRKILSRKNIKNFQRRF